MSNDRVSDNGNASNGEASSGRNDRDLGDGLETLPSRLRPAALRAWQRLCEAGVAKALPPGGPDPGRRRELARLLAFSHYAVEALAREPERLAELLASGDLGRGYRAGELAQRWRPLLSLDGEDALKRELRRARQREMVRIVWRDLNDLAPLDEILADLSALAEAALSVAVDWHYRRGCERYGTPRAGGQDAGDSGAANTNPDPSAGPVSAPAAAGEGQRLVVLGMGKLGGRELNFSSDIDLILAYPERGQTDAAKPLDNEQFFRRLGQQMVKTLAEVSADGFVFRVDLRLRPFGEAGPVAISFGAAEDYYQVHGRAWERYALIKARPVAGDREAGRRLLEMLRPFVYRRYLDYSAFASLREMKTLIDRETARKGLADNVKLGAGGIREIEFIGQAFQLIYGGREPRLRRQSLRPVLAELADSGRLTPQSVSELDQAYVFLRRVENRLQMWADRQTHQLPAADDEPARARLAASLGFDDWPSFERTLRQHRRQVARHFADLAALHQPHAAGEPSADGSPVPELAMPDVDALRDELARVGYPDDVAGEAARQVWQFRNGAACRVLGAVGRQRLRRLLPPLLTEIGHSDQPLPVLQRVIRLLETVAGRTVYLDLLLDRPGVRGQLIALCAASPWISDYLCQHPLLLDELLDPRALYRPLTPAELRRELRQALSAGGESGGPATGDVEQRLDRLRHFKHRNELKIAAADVSGALPLPKVSDRLTELAETVLGEALGLAWRDMCERFGAPRAERAGVPYRPALCIVGYGKLGGLELGYGSDLDLVFVHDSVGHGATDGDRPLDNGTFFARLAQRVIYYLTTLTAAGKGYEVDTRLRPSGQSGMLVSSIDAFADYQTHRAWLWEHQALARARPVAWLGDGGNGGNGGDGGGNGTDTHTAIDADTATDTAIDSDFGSGTYGDGRGGSLRARFAAVRHEILRRPRRRGEVCREVAQMRERMRRELGVKQDGRWHLKQDRGGIVDVEFIAQALVLAHAHAYPELARYSDNLRQLEAAEQAGLLSAGQGERLRDAYTELRSVSHRLRLQGLSDVIDTGAWPALDARREQVAELWRELIEASASAPDADADTDD